MKSERREVGLGGREKFRFKCVRTDTHTTPHTTNHAAGKEIKQIISGKCSEFFGRKVSVNE